MRVLSTTAYGEARTCLKSYQYHQVDRLISRPASISPKMRRGVWLHKALAEDSLGRDWPDVLVQCAQWAQEHGVPQDQIEKLHAECSEILAGYFLYWADRPTENWGDVVAVEEPVEAQVSPTLTLKATVDKIVRYKNGNWLVEHKSTSHIPDATWRAIDPQTAMQYAVCELSGRYQIDGILFDYLNTQPAPELRVKLNGRLYAGEEQRATTRAAWSQTAESIRQCWKKLPDDPETAAQYIARMQASTIREGVFFQRYPVFRPLSAIKETLKDIASIDQMLDLAARRQHYPRLQSMLYCPNFCLYAPLCASEYVSGQRSGMRDFDYQIEDLADREGR